MAYTANKLKSNFFSRIYIWDPADASVEDYIAWVPMGLNFLAEAALVSGGALVNFRIYAALDSSGTTPTLVVASTTFATVDTPGDQVALEVSQEQVLAALPRAAYVSVRLDSDTNTDIYAVHYLMESRQKYDGISGDVNLA